MKRFPFPGEAKEIRCTTDAWHEARALDYEQRKRSKQEDFDEGNLQTIMAKSGALCFTNRKLQASLPILHQKPVMQVRKERVIRTSVRMLWSPKLLQMRL